MFSELPKLLGRDFAIGFFLPVTAFLAACLGVALGFGLFPGLLTQLKADLLVGTTVFGLISWLVALLVLAVNRPMQRLWQGYGLLNPARLVGWAERRRFDKLTAEVHALDKTYKECIEGGREVPDGLDRRRSDALLTLARRFPDRREFVLPTKFGNIIRTFESYPRAMYGVEKVSVWYRLYPLLPADHRGLIDGAQAEVNFWMNIGTLSLVVIVEYVALAWYSGQSVAVWLPAALLTCAVFAATRANAAAEEWGEMTKAAFDLYLPKLRSALHLPAEGDRDQEREQWTAFSTAIVYRRPSYLPPRDAPRQDANEGDPD